MLVMIAPRFSFLRPLNAGDSVSVLCEVKFIKKKGEGADNVGNSSLCIFAPSGKDEVTRKTLTLSLNN